MELEIPGPSIKEFTRVLTCLTKFGDDIRIAVNPKQIKLSSFNASVSAFGVFTFEPTFFDRYDLSDKYTETNSVGLSVIAKALVAPFRSRASASVQSCQISLIEGDEDHQEDGLEPGSARLVIKLLCQHGVIKTHRLTYESCVPAYAKANRLDCTSTWTAPSRVLKDWTDHFHLRTGSGPNSSGTLEISFYCEENNCRVTSYGNEPSKDDPLSARPLNTELLVDVGDFDNYHIEGTPLISFALKEFKAIIILADYMSSNIIATFQNGGEPLIIEMTAEVFKADFVLSTTNYDGYSAEAEPKREESEASRAKPKSRSGSNDKRGSGSNRAASAVPSNQSRLDLPVKAKQPLFNPASQRDRSESAPLAVVPVIADDGGDEYDMLDLDFGEDDFARIDLLSQQIPANSSPTRAVQVVARAATHQGFLVPESTELDEDEMMTMSNDELSRSEAEFIVKGTPSRSDELEGMTEEEEFPATQEETHNPKKAKWNLFD